MDKNKTPEIKVIYPSQLDFSGDYYILTLSKEGDKIISKEGVHISSKHDFTTVLEDINQYNNEHDDKYRKLVK